MTKPITNAEARKRATEALVAGKILHVPLYAGGGVVTAGPDCSAVPKAGFNYIAYIYRPGGRNDEHKEFMASDLAWWLVDHCGRGNVRKAVEKANDKIS